MNFTTQHARIFLLAGFCILLLVHVAFTFCGFYGNDDINYARYAGEIVNTGKLTQSLTDHFPLRVTCIYTTAFFYYFLGFTPFATALFSCTCLLLASFLLYRLLKQQSLFLLLSALVLFFFCFITIFYAHRLLPDAGISLFVFAAYCAYYHMRFKQASVFFSALFWSVLMLLAVLTKESIIITVPLWLFLFFADLFFRRHLRFWIYASIICVFLGGMYLLYFRMETGDFFFRYHVLNRNSELGGGVTYQALGMTSLFKRLFFDLWNAFILNGDFQYLAFALAAFVYRKTVFSNVEEKHFALSFIVLLLSANFMSYSVNGYNPLLPDPRHFIFLVPFAALTGCFMIRAYWQNPRRYVFLPFLFIFIDIWLLFSDIGFTKYIYFGITLVLVTVWIFHNTVFQKSVSVGAIILWILIMSLNYINDFIRPRYPYYYDQEFIVKSQFNDSKERAIIYSGDDMTVELGDFFLAFKNNDQKFLNIKKIDSVQAEKNRTLYLLVNGDYNPEFKSNVDSLIQKGLIKSEDLISRRNNALLYKVSDVNTLHELEKKR